MILDEMTLQFVSDSATIDRVKGEMIPFTIEEETQDDATYANGFEKHQTPGTVDDSRFQPR